MAKAKKAVVKKTAKKEETVVPPVEEPKKEKLTDEQKMELERELRKYVKKGKPPYDKPGGFRKDLPEEDKKKALRIMKRLGRKEPQWDIKIVIPNYDLPEGEA